jgi:hypothetical protein
LARSAWSLRLIAEFRQRVTRGRDTVAWIPDYFCNESLRPLRELGTRLVFYPVAHDGSVDWAIVERLLHQSCPDLIVAVHYFGQPFDVEHLAALGRDCGAWLVEDAAHALRPTGPIGQRGDFVLYSQHKLLPIPDGALLVVRSTGAGGITSDVRARYDFDGLWRNYAANGAHAERRAYAWLAKRSAQRLGARSPNYATSRFLDDDNAGRALTAPRISELARRLLARYSSSLDVEASGRFANRAAWNQRLDGEPLAAPNTPYLAGFRYATRALAADAFGRLQSARLPVMTWPDLPPEVRAAPGDHHEAITMRETRIFLPVHRSVTPRTIDVAVR